jgi:hypothetical protein
MKNTEIKGNRGRISFRFCDFRERYNSFYFYLTESSKNTESMRIIDKSKEGKEEFLSNSVISVRNTILYISISQKAQKSRKGSMRRVSFRFCDFSV